MSQNLSGSVSITIETEEDIKFKLINVSIEAVDESSSSCTYTISGCTNPNAQNYNSEATNDDGSCLDECGVPNGDNSSCLDCAGVPNGPAEDLGCGCGNPAAQEGYDCDGNEIISYEVGDLAQGGMVFYVDETGQHGLVAATEDLLGTYEWGCYDKVLNGADGQAIGTGYQNTLDIVAQNCQTNNGDMTLAAQAALDAEINGYNDWYIPSIDELSEMYNTIGNGGPEGNIVGITNTYWSSSEDSNIYAWYFKFSNGSPVNHHKFGVLKVRVIRAF